MPVDLAFFGANVLKVLAGGWVLLAPAAVIFTLMTTWKTGRDLLGDILRQGVLPLELLLENLGRRRIHRVPGTAVFMTSATGGAPVVLLRHLKGNQVLHEEVILPSVRSAEVPDVDDGEQVTVEPLGQGFFRVVGTFGSMETPNVPAVLARARDAGGRRCPRRRATSSGARLLPHGTSPMARWRKQASVLMSRDARSATEFLGLPSSRVAELGAQIEF